MATLRKKGKLAAVSRETQEHPGNSQSQNTSVPRYTEYITQDSEEVEERASKQLLQVFILDALSKFDEFLLNPQERTFSGTVLGTSRNNDVESREPTGNRFQKDPRPKVEFSVRMSGNSIDSDQEETSHNQRSVLIDIGEVQSCVKNFASVRNKCCSVLILFHAFEHSRRWQHPLNAVAQNDHNSYIELLS